MGQSRFCSSRSANHEVLGKTAWESTSEIDRAEGLSNETLKPTTARLATSTASVSQGRPIDCLYSRSTTITSATV